MTPDEEDAMKHLIVHEDNSDEAWEQWQGSTDFGGLPGEEVKVKETTHEIMIEDIFKSVRVRNDL